MSCAMSSIPANERSAHASLAGQERAAREETNRATRGETRRGSLAGNNQAEYGETTQASPAGGERARREETHRAREKTETRTETELRPLSPYTIQNLDAAIAHLEIAMNADQSMAIFGRSYWHGRVLELRSTPGILHTQERRLLRLMDWFGAAG